MDHSRLVTSGNPVHPDSLVLRCKLGALGAKAEAAFQLSDYRLVGPVRLRTSIYKSTDGLNRLPRWCFLCLLLTSDKPCPSQRHK